MGCRFLIEGSDFSSEEIRQCIENNRILTIELEFESRCNLDCIYCYRNPHKQERTGLGLKEAKDIILQAKGLGAKRIILLGGGEPLLYRHFREMVCFIHSQGIKQTVFTNGTRIDKATAEFLYRHRVAVVVKRNSLTAKIQDKLANKKGAYAKIEEAIRLLRQCGYPSKDAQLGIQTVICRHNYHEIVPLWRWSRNNRIIPYVETLTFQGRAKDNPQLYVPVKEIGELFRQLADIDRREFGNEWLPHPPIAGMRCNRHLYTCLVNSKGDVFPCVGIDIAVGNIREKPLKEILSASPVIKKLRNIWEHIKGPCKDCILKYKCYGCRGNAYQLTGDYLAPDPYCWIAADNKQALKKKQELACAA